MSLGPVFERELRTTARGGRYYALRAAYGMLLVALTTSALRKTPGLVDGHGSVSLPALAHFARGLFPTLVFVQGLAVVLLTPALVSGAIAGEVQRKTLHDLFTSDLTDVEIIFGKLFARLLHVGVLLAVGLPLLIGLGHLGGIDPRFVLATELAMLSTAFFLGSLAILGSTQTRSTRGALNFCLTMTLTWLILPGAMVVLLPRSGWLGFAVYRAVHPVNAWISASSPFALWIAGLARTIGGPAALFERVRWMIGLQLVYGAALAGLATLCVRSTYRKREGRLSRRRAAEAAGGARRVGGWRPVCGDDPMIWKELFAARTPALYRPLGLFVSLVLGSLLAWSALDFAMPAFRELGAQGYGVAASGSARGQFHFYLRIVGTGIYVVYVLGVASDAAAGLASERERDTWISLISTPLTGTEIIRAKILGAIWGIRHTAVVLAALWLLGVLAGAVHPLGFVGALGELAVFTWFAASLGTWISLRSDQTMRAVARATGVLLAVNGLTLLAAIALGPEHPLAYAGCTPFVVAASLLSYGDVRGTAARSTLALFSDSWLASLWTEQGRAMVLACLAAAVGYAAAAWWLTRAACRGFDAQLDRPPLLGGDDEAVAREILARPHAATGQRRDRRPVAP